MNKPYSFPYGKTTQTAVLPATCLSNCPYRSLPFFIKLLFTISSHSIRRNSSFLVQKKNFFHRRTFALSHLSRLYLPKAIVNILPQNSFVNLLLLLFLLLLFIIFSWNFYSKFLLFSLIHFSFSCIFSSIFFVRKHILKFVVTYLFYFLWKNVNFCEICTLLSLFIYISSIYFYHFLTLINTFTHILPNRL